MNRLWVRFTLAFIAITQLSLFVVAVLADMGISTEFQQYVVVRTTSDMDQASQQLSFFFQQPGSAAVSASTVAGSAGATSPMLSAEPIFQAFSLFNGSSETAPVKNNNVSKSTGPSDVITGGLLTIGSSVSGSITNSAGTIGTAVGGSVISGAVTQDILTDGAMPAPLPETGQPFMLADTKGVVIYDRQGTRIGTTLSNGEMASTVPVKASDGSGQLVGYMYPGLYPGLPTPTNLLMQSPEQQFLNRLRTTLLVAALTVGLMGVVLGLVLSRTMTAPLANLTRAAHAFAKHDWSYRIKTRGASEIAAVARAFNEMADEIQRSETLRRNMIADIAHELRTPLAVMQGNLRALLDGVYALDRSEIATLYQETTMLSRLIDDLRELTHADSGQLDLHLTALDLRDMLGAAIANFSIAAESQNVQVTLDCAPDLPCARADVDRVNQILRNLLTNALRHTPGGSVTISAHPSADKAVCISIADTGEGIAPEDLPHVFDRFYRADKSRARTTGSSGLGLPIAKAWVEAMGGSIGADSTYGAGSRFWFTLPTG